MKKGKFLVLGLIALVLAGGLALASCRAGCEGSGACKVEDQKGTLCSNLKCDVFKHNGKSGACDC